MYLERVDLPDEDQEWGFRMSVRRTCFTSMYPFGLFPTLRGESLRFAPITILSGGNGCGKTTLLNVVAQKLGLRRSAPFNQSSFFEDYVRMTRVQLTEKVPPRSAIVSSDDVFDYMLDVRHVNEGVDLKREGLFEDYYRARRENVAVRSLKDYDALKKQNSARRKTQSAFVREQLPPNIPEKSNGESALFYFDQRLEMDALYLLDEPENSLSAQRQMELGKLLEESARHLGCQLVIATHSPFLLSLEGALVYDLDARPVAAKRWTQIENVRAYYDFFKDRRREFEDGD